ncbi:MAG: hypothetical protein WAQ27_03285 [Candidatus Microsaccharimonas sp.]
MELNRSIQIPKRLQTAEQLNEANWNFANVLAMGKWSSNAIDRVGITRTVRESLGAEYELDEAYIQPIMNELTLSFFALKKYVETKDGEDEVLIPSYKIISTTSQEIEKLEIPEKVLEEIFEDFDEDEDDDDDRDEDDEDYPINWAKQNLDEFDIHRVQQVEYDIDHEGEIEDYTISYEYLIDDRQVHEVSYTHSSDEYSWAPILLANGTSLEKRPVVLTVLTKDEIKLETKGIDTAFEEFMLEKSLRELTALSGLPKEEHIRRLLSMIGLVSGGFIRFDDKANV